MGVPDGAVHNLLSNKNNGIVTYSTTLVSHNVVKYLVIIPLSATSIITQCQINVPENCGILYPITCDWFTRFQELSNMKVKTYHYTT